MSGFGEFVRKKRLLRKLPFSEFCLRLDVDPVLWSRIERGRAPTPPKDVVSRIALAHDLRPEEPEWVELLELAQRDAQIVPSALSDAELEAHLPVLLRTHPDESRHGGDDSQEFLDDMKDLLKKAL